MKFEACPCSGKTLGRLVQPAVMALLAREPLHGYLLVQRLAGLAMFQGQPPDPTGVYRVLTAMQKQKLVASQWDLADRGPARRKFRLTPTGRACLKRWKTTLALYETAVCDLLAVIGRNRKRNYSTTTDE